MAEDLQQRINSIAELFYRCGGRHAVISPGSRNVPLIAAFIHHPGITCYSIPDERSGGFIGLGIAQQTKTPVALICTSGTAALNLYPSICEAWYQNIPLVAITADRPPELIDQWDGQAIRQNGIYRDHILYEHTIDPSVELDEIHIATIIRSCGTEKLPVHFNVPLNEPFYPTPTTDYSFQLREKWEEHQQAIPEKPLSLPEIMLSGLARVLVIVGAGEQTEASWNTLQKFAREHQVPVIVDIVSNDPFGMRIRMYDLFLNGAGDEYQPDVLLTLGKQLLSKNLRNYLRKHKPKQHIHIQERGDIGDPFQSLTDRARMDPSEFFTSMNGIHADPSYMETWKAADAKFSTEQWNAYLHQSPYSEIKAIHQAMKKIPGKYGLQLSNSMPVRYASLIGVKPGVPVYANRGTSGIDGCSSTAVGAALANTELTVLITGDIAFFYDINAFWHSHLPSNLRVVLINNGGGRIFRFVDGSEGVPELKPFMETPHHRSAGSLAADLGLDYYNAKNEQELNEILEYFFDERTKPAILEITCDPEVSMDVYSKLKKLAKSNKDLK